MITGADFDFNALSQLLESQQIVPLDQVGGGNNTDAAPRAQAAPQPAAQGNSKRQGKKGGNKGA